MKLAIRDRIDADLPESDEASVLTRATELTDSDAYRLKD